MHLRQPCKRVLKGRNESNGVNFHFLVYADEQYSASATEYPLVPTGRDHSFLTLVARLDLSSSTELVTRTSPSGTGLRSLLSAILHVAQWMMT